ncbi:MAG: hypothetical protein KDA96_24435 [Planctomycetaceae bacterium]|nr:hypothetical protein [Planctomycetaceae bacterium]
MARCLTWTGLCFTIALAGCGANNHDGTSTENGAVSQSISHDLTTPEGAILSLEDAYRTKDIEAAVRCKDFNIEAKLMLQKLEQDLSDDPEILAKMVEVLELGFRSELKNSGFPDFRDIESTFSDKKPYQGRDDIVQITEHCRHGDGTTTTNTLVVARAADGWKVVAVPE